MSSRILQAVTSVHVGEGNAVGALDLPLARERHSGWPFIPGSSLKGALRSRARFLDLDEAAILAAFGAEPGKADLGGASSIARRSRRVPTGRGKGLPLRRLGLGRRISGP